jgi:hypothetical protein
MGRIKKPVRKISVQVFLTNALKTRFFCSKIRFILRGPLFQKKSEKIRNKSEINQKKIRKNKKNQRKSAQSAQSVVYKVAKELAFFFNLTIILNALFPKFKKHEIRFY